MGERERALVRAPAAGHGGEALLWDLTDSPFCAKVRMCLHLKGIAYRRVTLTVGRLLALRRLNPRGQVPVLQHAGRTIPDSTAIVRYLEDEVGGPPLLPPDAAARAYCDLVEDWADEALSPLVGACKWRNPANRATALARTVPEIAGGWPHWIVGPAVVLRNAVRHRGAGLTRATLAVVAARLQDGLATWAALLADREFLLGRTPTLADVAVFAQLACLRGYAEGALVDEQPAVARWAERMLALPAVAAALR
jgi:glutathione S-transferase